MGLLDVYPEGQSRAEAAKILLQQFLIDYDRPLSHPLMVDHLLSIARILHDTLKYHLTNTRLYRLLKLNVCVFSFRFQRHQRRGRKATDQRASYHPY